MPVDASEITPAMLDAVNASLRVTGHDGIELYALSAAMRDFLNLPETREVVATAAEREHAEMMAALPGWGDMSDLDKGAALLHIHKRDSEGDEYAVENYPVKYIEDPRLTALSRQDACAHAARFEGLAEELDGDEHGRLYDLALDHERSN
jgi:hypothetical protein